MEIYTCASFPVRDVTDGLTLTCCAAYYLTGSWGLQMSEQSEALCTRQ